jgi:hypothetical protein
VTAIVAGIALGTVASADGMSKTGFEAAQHDIDTEYKAAKAGCDSLAGNAGDSCVAEAKGKAGVARADLQAQYQSTTRHNYDLRVARADAEYAVAREKCDAQSGEAQDLCIAAAKGRFGQN